MAFEQPVYNIWIRNQNAVGNSPPTGLKREALVTDYVKLEFKSRYNDVGGWTLLMRDGTEQANLLRKLLYGSPDDPQGETSSGRGYGGITVVRNGTIVFSGPVRGFVATGDENDGPMIEFHGCDDTGYLSSRICMVPKNTVAPPIPSAEFKPPTNTGWGTYVYPPTNLEIRSAAECLSNLVLFNIANSANPAFAPRRIPFLTVPPAGQIGPRTRVRQRYQNLLEKCQEVATYAPLDSQDPDYNVNYRGLQFYIRQTQTDQLECIIRAPLDQRGTVVLSLGNPDDHTPGNIGTYEYSFDAPTANFAVVGGQGEGENRWFRNRGAQYAPGSVAKNSILTYGVWETFLDRRDIQYDNPGTPPPINPEMRGELTRALDTVLRDEGEVTNLNVTAINTGNTRYFETYNLGDIITVRIGGEDIIGQVMDATVTLTKAEGEVVVPNIGTQVIGSQVKLFTELYKTQTDIRHLYIR
jgi:hypothetical protein